MRGSGQPGHSAAYVVGRSSVERRACVVASGGSCGERGELGVCAFAVLHVFGVCGAGMAQDPADCADCSQHDMLAAGDLVFQRGIHDVLAAVQIASRRKPDACLNLVKPYFVAIFK